MLFHYGNCIICIVMCGIVDSSNTDLLVLGWVGVMSINSDVLSSGVFGQLSTADPIGMTLCHPPVSYSMPLFVRI